MVLGLSLPLDLVTTAANDAHLDEAGKGGGAE